mgnify:CR=1 FL=1
MVRQQDLAGLVDALSLGHEELHVLVLAEECADRVCDLVRREDRRRYLVQERLEELEVVTVNEQDVNILLRKEFGELDAAGAGPGLALALAPVADRVQGLAGLEVGRGAEGDVRGLDVRSVAVQVMAVSEADEPSQLTLPENSRPGWLAPGICEPLPLEKITR